MCFVRTCGSTSVEANVKGEQTVVFGFRGFLIMSLSRLIKACQDMPGTSMDMLVRGWRKEASIKFPRGCKLDRTRPPPPHGNPGASSTFVLPDRFEATLPQLARASTRWVSNTSSLSRRTLEFQMSGKMDFSFAFVTFPAE